VTANTPTDPNDSARPTLSKPSRPEKPPAVDVGTRKHKKRKQGRLPALGRFYDRVSLGRALGVGPRGVDRLVRKHGLPGLIVGRKKLFDGEAVAEWIANGGAERELPPEPPKPETGQGSRPRVGYLKVGGVK
jgi:hypothetical protein